MSSMSSSLSLAPTNYCRKAVRLAEPKSSTIEQLNGSALAIFVTLPLGIVNKYVGLIPNYGLDTLTVNYTDGQGQSGQFTRAVTFWGSDAGWIFLSADQGTQLLVASVNGAFFDANAISINNRNVNAGAPGLLPCCNAARYDAPALLPNQVLPQVWIRDGSSMSV